MSTTATDVANVCNHESAPMVTPEFKEGMQHRAGTVVNSLADNPYDVGTAEYYSWAEGYATQCDLEGDEGNEP